MSSIVRLSYDDVDRAVAQLAKAVYSPRIIAIARGGLIPATMLAHRLNVRHVDSVTVYARNNDGTALMEPVIMGSLPPCDPGTIIVDDIADSGKTYQTMRRAYPQGIFVALVSHVPDVIGVIKTPKGHWVKFFWEQE